MDYDKIGRFIAERRKALNFTQEKLAEKLFVSAKTVSKWENGNGVPDTNTLPTLCNVLDITVNELLNGEKISVENYTDMAENKLLELKKAKEDSDKRLLFFEIVIGVIALIYFLSLSLVAAYIEMETWIRIVLIVGGLVLFLILSFFMLRIEQKAGLYECGNCHHKHVPTYNQVLWAMHMGRTRYMKCPHCNKKSWHKKVIK